MTRTDQPMTLTDEDAPSPAAPDDAVPNGSLAGVARLLVALALITIVFVALGWGYLLLFIAILVAIGMLHELGHS